MNASARRTRGASEIGHDPPLLAAAGAADVDEVDVGDVDAAGVLGADGLVDVEVALVEHDGEVGVLDADVLVRDVADVAVADVRAGPGLEPRAVLAVEQRHVLDVRVGDVVQHARVLPDAAHAHPVRAVAPQVAHQDVGRVGLGREAVVAHVDARVEHRQAGDVERVEAVCVLGQGL